MCEITGATYRQIDYWDRTGLIHSRSVRQSGLTGRAEGSGTIRTYSGDEVDVVHALVAASKVAAHPRDTYEAVVEAVRTGRQEATIGNVTLRWDCRTP